MGMNKELLAKAKEMKTPEELMALAKENGVELTEESAAAYFDRLHPQTGELSDDELTTWPAAAATPAEDALKPPAATSAGTMWMDLPPSA